MELVFLHTVVERRREKVDSSDDFRPFADLPTKCQRFEACTFEGIHKLKASVEDKHPVERKPLDKGTSLEEEQYYLIWKLADYLL